MTLRGLLGRALGIALIFGVLLLPAADHHLAGRLPGAHGSTVHRHVTHHHNATDHPTDAAPLVLPIGAASLGADLPSPFAAGGLDLPPLRTLRHAGPSVDATPPVELVESPPLPPPIFPA